MAVDIHGHLCIQCFAHFSDKFELPVNVWVEHNIINTQVFKISCPLYRTNPVKDGSAYFKIRVVFLNKLNQVRN